MKLHQYFSVIATLLFILSCERTDNYDPKERLCSELKISLQLVEGYYLNKEKFPDNIDRVILFKQMNPSVDFVTITISGKQYVLTFAPIVKDGLSQIIYVVRNERRGDFQCFITTKKVFFEAIEQDKTPEPLEEYK